jgi:hypothetical protein
MIRISAISAKSKCSIIPHKSKITTQNKCRRKGNLIKEDSKQVLRAIYKVGNAPRPN